MTDARDGNRYGETQLQVEASRDLTRCLDPEQPQCAPQPRTLAPCTRQHALYRKLRTRGHLSPRQHMPH